MGRNAHRPADALGEIDEATKLIRTNMRLGAAGVGACFVLALVLVLLYFVRLQL